MAKVHLAALHGLVRHSHWGFDAILGRRILADP